jgi:murein DD-endopeptidase MepM/ murein hydrolase activator NlpD
MPEYNMCFLKKGIEPNDNEIFDTVIASGIPFYKYYAIMENNQEKFYVATYEECENVIQTLKDKNSNNKDSVTYALKYETELKELTTTELAINGLYVEKPKTSANKKVNTMKTMDYSNTALGINLIRPISGTITSRFGRRSRGTHTGLDIATSKGVPIKAAASGTVIYSGTKGAYGKMVVIDHGNGIQTYYAHCSRLDVSSGTYVNQGDVIGAVGSTGNSTGPHLHLEVRVNGVAKNPQNYVY